MSRWDGAWHRRLMRLVVDLPFRPAEEQSAIRRRLAQDPVAFARLYLAHHLKNKTDGSVTFSEVHYAWAEQALTWADGPPTEPQQGRHAFIAPRECGKSTWWFLIIPLWAAANGHVRFAAAFAHSASQAELHLKTLKTELDTNALLQLDYPDLCQPKRRPSSGTTVSDNAGMLIQGSGFIFAARGIDSATLGMKVGDQRPDLLILDDVEPDEASYSPALATKRLGTITDAIFPLNVYARVAMVGTVTMPGSIMHQLVKAAAGLPPTDPDNNWVAEQEIRAHHAQAIVRDDAGAERSVWPEKWPLEFLNKIRHTRMYAKNYANDPMSRDSVYWRKEDFRYSSLTRRTRTMLVVDPAVTQRKTSDFTGLVVVSWEPPAGGRPTKRDPGMCEIEEAVGVRLTGAPLRVFLAEKFLPRFPHLRYILVETNQGGDLWAGPGGVLTGLGVKVGTHWSKDSKEVRFARELDHWQRGRVVQTRQIPILEEQAIGFPNAAYDDVIDAGVAGVHYFLTRPFTVVRTSQKAESYV
jgi:hypothetical protein